MSTHLRMNGSRSRSCGIRAFTLTLCKFVDPDCIATKGYGAMPAIYEHASANERIEVEIKRN
jgi:hypothetical protein